MPGNRFTAAFICAAAISIAAGCNQNPYVAAPPPTAWQSQQYPQQQQQYARFEALDRRATALDADNRDLHAELARSQQQAQLLRDEVELLRRQLQEKATELRDVLVAKQGVERRVETIEASTRFRGGATITANNSLQLPLPDGQFADLEARRDDDLIRIELSADRLFHGGTDQLLPSASHLVDRLATLISQSYPRQLIGIEGHTDSLPSGGGSSSHQLSTAQAVAITEALTRRNRLPARQLFVVGYGAHHPRVSNATPAGRTQNRRIEVVVYPETL